MVCRAHLPSLLFIVKLNIYTDSEIIKLVFRNFISLRFTFIKFIFIQILNLRNWCCSWLSEMFYVILRLVSCHILILSLYLFVLYLWKVFYNVLYDGFLLLFISSHVLQFQYVVKACVWCSLSEDMGCVFVFQLGPMVGVRLFAVPLGSYWFY